MMENIQDFAADIARVVEAIQAIDVAAMNAEVDDIRARYNAAVLAIGSEMLQRNRAEWLTHAALNIDDHQAINPGVDKDAAMRITANELLYTTAFIVRALKRRRGEDISPARFALMAFDVARTVAIPDWGTPDVSESMFDKEPGSFRRALFEDMDKASGGPESHAHEPPPGLLMSMAMRMDHGLGSPGYYDTPIFAGTGLTHAQRLAGALDTCRKLWEEATGSGFYRPEREAEYASLRSATGESP